MQQIDAARRSQIARETPIEGADRFGKMVNSYNFNESGFCWCNSPRRRVHDGACSEFA
jgi:hypothetical protein